MHLTRIELQGLPPLRWGEFPLDERVNLFIGPNASGKSTILRAIKELHSLAIKSEAYFVPHEDVTHIPDGVGLITSDDWPRHTSDSSDPGMPDWREVPFLYLPATRVNLPLMDVFGQTVEEIGRVEFSHTGKSLFETDYGIFNGRYVESWTEVFRRDFRDKNQREQLEKAIQISHSLIRCVCPEVIHDASPHTYVETTIDSLGGEEVLERHYNMGIVTIDDRLGEGLYVGALSSGTQGMILWVRALAIEIAHHYGWKEGWEKQPAILLIDEIENHLHPTWQRRVIPALQRFFPGLQIFATTHSPFVVAGLKAGQVHLLKRDENGVVTANTNSEDIVGWTADEILRNMMGVDEPTDQLTVDRANRLRQLREKESLTDDEETELAELRRQVNADLLSKEGPLGAQRERYADLMEKFLLSRQSGPTQDGD